MYEYLKNKRRKENKFVEDGVRSDSFFLQCIDSLVENLFQPELLKLLDIDSIDLGNHLSSFVSAKDFQNELKQLMPQIKKLRANTKTFKRKNSSTYQFVSRMSDINRITSETQGLLTHFNKTKLFAFLSKTENLVIFEHVLLKVSQHNEIAMKAKKYSIQDELRVVY